RVLEHRARLLADLPAGVAGGDVDEREQAYVGVARDRRGPRGGRVPRLGGAVSLLLEEGRLVNEQVRSVRGDAHGLGRRRVARHEDLAPGAGRPDHLLGRHAVDRLAVLEAPEVRSGPHAEPLGGLGVEFARALVLPKYEAERRNAVLDADRGHRVAIAANLVRRVELLDPQLVAQAAVDRA